MKKNLMTLAAVFCCMISVTVLTSCMDKVDNPVPQEPTMIDPVADTYIIDRDVDRNVRPGDSFYHFAVGSWLKGHAPKDLSLRQENDAFINNLCNDALKNCTDPQVRHLVNSLYSTPDSVKEFEAIKRVMSAMFDENGELDLLTGWGVLADLGYTTPIYRSMNIKNNLYYYTLTSGISAQEKSYRQTGNIDLLRNYVRNCIKPFVEDPSQLDEWVEKVMELGDKAWAARNSQLTGTLMERLQGEKLPQYSLANAMMGRRAGSLDFSLEELAKAFYLDLSRDKVDSKFIPFFDELANQDPQVLYMYTAYLVMMDNNTFMPGFFGFSVEKNYDMVMHFIKAAAPALINIAEAEALAPAVNQQECLADMERLRVKMAQRIQNLDWMSDATKEAALQKLKKMQFHAGVPDNLVGRDGFNLTGETLLEDMMQARAQNYALNMAYIGKPTYGHFAELLPLSQTLSTANAFYSADFNGVYILPTYCSKVIYPQSNSEPDMLRRYATFYVFAHELCHGFDSTGSQYDGEGYMRDWWTPSDKQKFESKQQQMVDLFNELWAYEGQHANGVMTLSENMADFGGLRLTFEIFKDLLVEKGYYGESLKHMLREFFMHYAQVWKEEDRGLDGYKLQYLTDVHSTSTNRINGIVRLMDEWYDLFQVKSGDIYVDPADRPHIW